MPARQARGFVVRLVAGSRKTAGNEKQMMRLQQRTHLLVWNKHCQPKELRVFSSLNSNQSQETQQPFMAWAGLGLLTLTSAVIAACEQQPKPQKTPTLIEDHHHWTPSEVAREDFKKLVDEHEEQINDSPLYTSDQVAENDGTDGKPVWMSYGGVRKEDAFI